MHYIQLCIECFDDNITDKLAYKPGIYVLYLLRDAMVSLFRQIPNIPWIIYSKFDGMLSTPLKNKTEDNSISEGAFCQRKWVKINSISVILVFSLYVCCCFAFE